MPIKELIEKIKALPLPWRKKSLEPEAAPSPPAKPINKKLIIGLVAFSLLLGIIWILRSLPQKEAEKAGVSPSPSPTTAEEEVIIPSIYATDSAVLKLEGSLSELETNLLETDLSEAGLNPPLLDWEVEFEENSS